ncbi:MAG: alpha-amylase family glycosyl hydrolase [Candidatus Krumholzibacteriia bacterium]
MKDSAAIRDLRDYFALGFATSDEAWRRYALTELVPAGEEASAEDLRYAVRKLADRLAEARARRTTPLPEVKAERLLALSALNDALRFLGRRYLTDDNPGAVSRGRAFAEHKIGPDIVTGVNHRFGELFPPTEVQQRRIDLEQWLQRDRSSERITVELILLFLQMRNPAATAYRELFDDEELQRRASYVPYVVALEEFFDREPPSGRTGMTLFAFLRAPILAAPDSLEGQLAYVRDHWAGLLPDDLIARLDLARDLLREEDVFRGVGFGGVPPVLEFGPGTAGAYSGYPEPESFTRDADWMSNVVLIAKSTYVWLDQLSRWHGRRIERLDEIPDEELDRLARWGVNGLWLIGLWERSHASRTIKQWLGNPEAVASAYSLYDYAIAADLGGAEAYENLRRRAWDRGIRLASDMVPNHMGIDSRWVLEHPDWFVQVPHPPYPGYRFTSENLARDDRMAIQIEDGYWDKSDAAVVFKRTDPRSGEARYIYHGNDGTSMPWNDTAQLDFTRADVREAVVQTILHVARMFPIIRFDAAMTLAKKHYQRLWFPAPGDAGAIPSRAEHSMIRERFDQVFPKEFWREVVDRIQAEAPDTLLLAEAFWLMEGYFVRTLGMHRVYNSAFMNMLKMEENQKYRQTIKNVLEFSPEVLKRFVNFMNNPDERTAVEQFGKGDKYFGVAVMMVTMPGLPMLGHGQIEGFAEKYGMEYRRAYWDEPIDRDMVSRHEREVFPLMRRRALFSSADNFAIYDLVRDDGGVDENVFAYTNRHGDERALVIYNNAYAGTAGRIHTASAVNTGPADAPHLVQRSLADALGVRDEDGLFYAFRDAITGREYLRHGHEIGGGFHADLRGYQYQVFLDWREVRDHDGVWARVHSHLAGRSVPSLEWARRETELEPVLTWLEGRLREDLADIAPATRDAGRTSRPGGEAAGGRDASADPAADPATQAADPAAQAADPAAKTADPAARPAEPATRAAAPEAEQAPARESTAGPPSGRERGDNAEGPLDAVRATGGGAEREDLPPVEQDFPAGSYHRAPALPPNALAITRAILGEAAARIEAESGPGKAVRRRRPARGLDAELLVARAGAVLADWPPGGDAAAVWFGARLAGLLAWRPGLLAAAGRGEAGNLLRALADDPVASQYLGINRHEGQIYLRGETLEQWIGAEALLESPADEQRRQAAHDLLRNAASAGYRLGVLADILDRGTSPDHS